MLADPGEDERYADPGLRPQSNPGEISAEALDRLQAMLAGALLDRGRFARWFGRHTSARKYPEVDWAPDEAVTPAALRAALAGGAVLERNPASRFAFVVAADDALELFVDGQGYACSGLAADLARQLCAQDRIAGESALTDCEPALALIAARYNQGSLAFADED